MKPRIVLATFVFMIVAMLAYASQASNAVGWGPNNRSIRIEDRTGDADWRVAIIHAVDSWKNTGANIHPFFTTDPSFSGACNYHGATVSICRSDQIKGTEAGQTFRYYSNGYMTDSFILITPIQLDNSEKQVIACHEIGHALGLEHNPNPDSCLYANTHTTNIGPDPSTDYATLREIYK